MPKRLIDDSLLTSPSLAKCSPRAQDAFPRFILLADDFGCFEAFPRVLRAKGWPYRDDVSEGDVWTFLEEYVAAGMACVWTEGERRWCYLTGWHGPHGQKKRVEYDPASVSGSKGSKRRTPPPPADLVAAVVAGAVRAIDGKPPGTDRETPGEIPSLSVPAREVSVSRQVPGESPAGSRSIPAPVVPVPAADVVADGGKKPHPRARLISGLGAADPHPEISAVLAALWDRGHDAAAPADKSAGRVKAAIVEATIPVAVERLSAVYARPGAEKPLTYHVDAIRGLTAPTGKPPPPTPPSLDADWLESLPEDERGRARVAWAELVERVKRSAYPDAFPRLAAEAKEQFQATWQTEEATA